MCLHRVHSNRYLKYIKLKRYTMTIQFCGAAQYVTGSCHLITLENGYTILLDCGLFQGKGEFIWEWNNTWLFDPSTIDCVILSHAHIDHSGRLPKLFKDGFRGTIHSTHATRNLCSVMLMDSAKIQESDIQFHNKKIIDKGKKKSKGKKLREPLYEEQHVKGCMQLFDSHSYDTWITINNDIQLIFRDAGHILGSASITLKIVENNKEVLIGFTGDIGRPDRPILKDPHPMPEVDYLICESTYGDKDHESIPEQMDKFLSIIQQTCIYKKGKLIIPAFSLGRTQEIVYMMDKLENQNKLPPIQIIVDSPLAVNVTDIFKLHTECFDDNLLQYLLTDPNPFGFNNLIYNKDVNFSKSLNEENRPMVIISASGMMNAGRVKHHLFNNIDKKNNSFLIAGYCTPETPGGQLRAGAKELTLFGIKKEVKADIEVMDSFSAHGDRQEMYTFIKNQRTKLKKLFLVHGEKDTQEAFSTFLKNKGFKDIHIPQKGEKYHI